MQSYLVLNQQLQTTIDKFDLNQSQGGCSLCIYHQGQLVSQLSSGIARIDKQTGKQTYWNSHTLSLNFSTGKGILATLVHILVSERLLNYDSYVAKYWQGFDKNGKEFIKLSDILSHSAGLFDITQITSHAKDMLDWQAMLDNVEQMSISHDNEKPVAYSALVSGWILGGIIEKVTGLSLQQALDEYLAKPLGIQGQLFFGVPDEKLSEVALPIRDKEHRNKPTLNEDTTETLEFYQSLPFYECWQKLATSQGISEKLTTQRINQLYFSPNDININDYRSALVPVGSRQFNYHHASSLQAKIPAANAVATSYAMATIYAMLANAGHWQGKTLISPTVFQQLSQIQNNQFDKIMPAVMQWRLGYHRVFSVCQKVENYQHAFGHMGYNGSVAWCDPTQQLAVAFLHNYDVTMLTDIRQFIINEIILKFFSEERE